MYLVIKTKDPNGSPFTYNTTNTTDKAILESDKFVGGIKNRQSRKITWTSLLSLLRLEVNARSSSSARTVAGHSWGERRRRDNEISRLEPGKRCFRRFICKARTSSGWVVLIDSLGERCQYMHKICNGTHLEDWKFTSSRPRIMSCESLITAHPKPHPWSSSVV